MKWYKRYFDILGIPFSDLDPKIVEQIRHAVEHNTTAESPRVTVAVIAYNEERNLAGCVWSLAENRSKYPFEIIVINNRSTDGTQQVIDSLGVRSLFEEIPGAGAARQRGLIEARGEYYLCIDSDTLYPPRYIETMVDALNRTDTAAAYAIWNFIPDARNGAISLTIYQWFRDLHKWIQSFKRPELGVGGAAFAFRTEHGRQIGFRTDIKRGEDGSMALGLKKYGRLRIIMSSRARVMTSVITLSREGSLIEIFWLRVKRAFGNFGEYTHTKESYEDTDINKF